MYSQKLLLKFSYILLKILAKIALRIQKVLQKITPKDCPGISFKVLPNLCRSSRKCFFKIFFQTLFQISFRDFFQFFLEFPSKIVLFLISRNFSEKSLDFQKFARQIIRKFIGKFLKNLCEIFQKFYW